MVQEVRTFLVALNNKLSATAAQCSVKPAKCGCAMAISGLAYYCCIHLDVALMNPLFAGFV